MFRALSVLVAASVLAFACSDPVEAPPPSPSAS